MKKKWIIIIIIFLLAANAALISTLVINNNANSPSSIEPKELINRKTPGGFERHIAEELKLNEQQRSQLKEFSKEFHESRFEHFEKIAQIKKMYFTSLTSEKTETELKELADSLGKIHAEMMLLDYQHYKNIRSICTKEQAMVFDSLGNKRIINRELRMKNSRNGWRHHKSGKHLNSNKKSNCNENK